MRDRTAAAVLVAATVALAAAFQAGQRPPPPVGPVFNVLEHQAKDHVYPPRRIYVRPYVSDGDNRPDPDDLEMLEIDPDDET